MGAMRMTVGSEVRESRAMLWTLTGIALVLLVIGCATVLHGTTQEVGVSRTSPGAHVAVDTVLPGQTQSITNMAREDYHVAKIVIPRPNHMKRHPTSAASTNAC